MTAAIFLLVAAVIQGDTGSFVIKDFRFASDETLAELPITAPWATRTATRPASSGTRS